MIDMIANVLVFVWTVVLLPLLMLALLRSTTRAQRLAERNAAQAAIICRLEERLRRRDASSLAAAQYRFHDPSENIWPGPVDRVHGDT